MTMTTYPEGKAKLHNLLFIQKIPDDNVETTTKMASVSDIPSFEKCQLKATTVRERNELMFNNEILSDVHFLVGKEKARIPGHKYVLAISSPVFFAMFYGRMAEQESDVAVSDSEVECFMELLRFVYTDEAVLTLDNALGVLYLAEKYMLPVLAAKCINFVEASLNPENALTVLCHARYLGKETLQERCWEMIDTYTTQVLESEAFPDLDVENLSLLVQRDTISAKEIQMFKAVNSWSENECFRQGIEVTADNKRVVSSQAMKFIRFPTMSPLEFADEVARSGMLSYEETTNIFLYFFSSMETKLQFSKIPRTPRGTMLKKTLRCSRFKSCCGNDWFCDTRKCDAIKFMVDRPIYVKGIAVYGASKIEGDYTTSVELLKQTKVLAERKRAFSSDTGSTLHDILFDSAHLIEKNVVYTVNLLLQGPCSQSGRDGFPTVVTEGVTFTFIEHTSPNGTSESAGQIPEIIFHL